MVFCEHEDDPGAADDYECKAEPTYHVVFSLTDNLRDGYARDQETFLCTSHLGDMFVAAADDFGIRPSPVVFEVRPIERTVPQ